MHSVHIPHGPRAFSFHLARAMRIEMESEAMGRCERSGEAERAAGFGPYAAEVALSGVSDGAKALYGYLAVCAGARGWAYVRSRTAAKESHCKVSSYYMRRRELEAAGFVYVRPRCSADGGKTTPITIVLTHDSDGYPVLPDPRSSFFDRKCGRQLPAGAEMPTGVRLVDPLDRDAVTGGGERRGEKGYGTYVRVVAESTVSAGAKALYGYLAAKAGSSGWTVLRSTTITAETGMSDRTYHNRRRELERAGFVLVRARYGRADGRQLASLFILLASDEHGELVMADPRSKRFDELCNLQLDTEIPSPDGVRIVDCEEIMSAPRRARARRRRGTAERRARSCAAESGGTIAATAQAAPNRRPEAGRCGFSTAPAAESGECMGAAESRACSQVAHSSGSGNGHAASAIPGAGSRAREAFEEIAGSAVNRNRLRSDADIAACERRVCVLVGTGTDPRDLVRAWESKQREAAADGREERYYPQVMRWLLDEGDGGARAMSKRAAAKRRRGERLKRNLAVSTLMDRDDALKSAWEAVREAKSRMELGIDVRGALESAQRAFDRRLAQIAPQLASPCAA